MGMSKLSIGVDPVVDRASIDRIARGIYVACPWATVAGIARRLGASPVAVEAALRGRRGGARDLIADRATHRDTIAAALSGRGRVAPERPDQRDGRRRRPSRLRRALRRIRHLIGRSQSDGQLLRHRHGG